MRILKVRVHSPAEFFDLYARELPDGGLFCPTTEPVAADEAVVVELSGALLPNKVLLRGDVRWWRPAVPRLRVRAGALVAFSAEEGDKHAFVLRAMEGNAAPARRRRHTRFPVALPVRYRLTDSAEPHESDLREISVGGALLRTPQPLPLGTEVILELIPPGAVQPIEISGRATYHNGPAATGLRFVYRDGGGSRRLRELIRRIKLA